MEILLLIGLGAFAYVYWKQSRGERVNVAGMAGGCLGLGCLGVILLCIAAVVVLWLLLQSLGDIDLSLSDWFDAGGRDNGGGGGGGGNDGTRLD